MKTPSFPHIFLPILSVIVAIFVATSLSGCDSAPPPTRNYTTPLTPRTQADRGDRLVMALSANPTNLVPFLAGESAASTITQHLYQSLITYDKNLNLVPELAQSWHISNAGKTITFTLKPGLKFSNGTPLTSADVLATFNAITDPNTPTPYAGDYQLVQKAEAPTPRTFRVTYASAFAPALSNWAALVILPKAEIDKSRAADGTLTLANTALKENPIGTGPYQLSHWRRGQSLLLSLNPHAQPLPYIQQILYRILPDASSQWLELKAGNLDIADLSPLQYARLTDAPWFTQRYNKYNWLSNTYTYIGFNLKNPLFQSTPVRQALSYAIDRNGIVAAVLYGQGQPIAGVFKPGTWAYNSTLQPYPYNPQKAKQMLAQQGWLPGPDGILTKNGQRFAFTLTTNQGASERVKTAEIIQKMFADIGVDMTIRVQEWSSFVTNTIKKRQFEAVMLGWSLAIEPDPYDIWHSSKTKPDEFNFISFSNPQADKLMEQARHEFNQTKRKQLLWQFQEILHQQQPYLWLYAPNVMVAVHKRIQNISPTTAGISYNQPDWYVPQAWHLRPTLQP